MDSSVYEKFTDIPLLSESEKQSLSEKRVLVLGLGGLGGYICELLCRLGVRHLTAVDGDVFEPSNLNRQLYAGFDSLKKSKAEETKRQILRIDPECDVTAVNAFFNAENAEELIKGQDLVMDGLDESSPRLLAADTASRFGIPLIHGAIDGLTLHVATVLPGCPMLHRLYEGGDAGRKPGPTLSFVPAVCAGIQVGEAARILSGRPGNLENTLYLMDLSTLESHLINYS